MSAEICRSIRLRGGRSCADSARGTRPSGLPFSAVAGNGYGNYRCCALPCPPERQRAGWVNTANLFIREYKRSENLIGKFRGYLALGVPALVDERATEVLGVVM